jgi:hypothetical protein
VKTSPHSLECGQDTSALHDNVETRGLDRRLRSQHPRKLVWCESGILQSRRRIALERSACEVVEDLLRICHVIGPVLGRVTLGDRRFIAGFASPLLLVVLAATGAAAEDP